VKVLITGCNGFLGKELTHRFVKKTAHKIFPTNHKTLDMTNLEQVQEFFNHTEIDVVIHCAVVGGKRTDEDSLFDMSQNFKMTKNLIKTQQYYGRLFMFGSGAEYSRLRGVDKFTEDDFINADSIPEPPDFYGIGKTIVTDNLRKGIWNNKATILRLFGCFGVEEPKSRLLKANMINYLKKEPMTLHMNKEMSYFYAGDVFRVIDWLLENPDFDKHELNLVYHSGKTTHINEYLRYLLNQVNGLGDHKVPIRVSEPDSFGLPYSGRSLYLHNLGIDFIGLEKGIKKMYKKLKSVI